MVYMEYGRMFEYQAKIKVAEKTSFMSKQFLQQDINNALYCISIQL